MSRQLRLKKDIEDTRKRVRKVIWHLLLKSGTRIRSGEIGKVGRLSREALFKKSHVREEDEEEGRRGEKRGGRQQRRRDEPWLAATHLGTFSKQGRKSNTPGKN
ncbi:unnamed protein product [Pleuronectes platessa]|uniref:Uncharacterized protein n=1 Tax=Pleuronectes platessa TaxID=8262 RepID=A0A9N7VI12_PLEPL|nr:unnamed protein product [Pleuronectes platessa]